MPGIYAVCHAVHGHLRAILILPCCSLFQSLVFFLPGSPVSKLSPGAMFTASPLLFYETGSDLALWALWGLSLFVYKTLLWLKSAQLNMLFTLHGKQ